MTASASTTSPADPQDRPQTDAAADPAPAPAPLKTFLRQFVPRDFNPADFAQIEPLADDLLRRPLDSAADIEHWLADLSELSSVIDEYGSRRYIDKSCHTEDEGVQKRFMQFVEEVEPKIKPLFFQLQKKYLDSPHRARLDPNRYAILDRQWRVDVELFREANVPLETEVTKKVTAYDQICGAMTVQFEGQERTMQQMGRYQEKIDRDLRQRAWEASSQRRLIERDKVDGIFEELLGLRARIADNAGQGDYRAYIWQARKRFDYTPQDCLEFDRAIAEAVVPIRDELDRRRREDLGVGQLRPWDLLVDPQGRPPLEPFKEDQVPQFVAKVKTIFDRMSPSLGAEFDTLRQRGNLDLESRKGKQPGGYQCSLDESREPFIFMNAVGVHGDVETMLHEGGHAFHCLAAREEPLVFLRSAPMEFCEVASMAMELLGAEHFDVFYPGPAESARAKRGKFEDVIVFLPWMATIDAFQHWIYTHPGHARDQRTAEWLRLMDLYYRKVDWTGHEDVKAAFWQRQLHIVRHPFYYIEYGIAQLGALQLWLKAREDPRKALANYRAALALGGTRPLPDLFAAAGIRFDFSAQTLIPLMSAVREELASLPR